jgi:hypothetical protein
MITLSARQFTLLERFASYRSGQHVSVAEAGRWNQTTFRSMLVRDYVRYRPGKGFHLTERGHEAYGTFLAMPIDRKHPSLKLTSYFDLSTVEPPVRSQATGGKRDTHSTAA